MSAEEGIVLRSPGDVSDRIVVKGIIDDPTVARPSRSLTAEEVAELNRRLQVLPRVPSRD